MNKNWSLKTLKGICIFLLAGVDLIAGPMDQVQRYGSLGLQQIIMNFAISNLSPSGKIFLIGGQDANRNLYNSIQSFDPRTKIWTTLPYSLPYPYYNNQRHGAAFASNGKLYVCPGNTNSGWGEHSRIIEVDPAAGVARERGSITGGSGNIWDIAIAPAPKTIGGVYLFGGWNGGGISSISHYNPETDTFRSVGQLSFARNVGVKVIHPNGKVYLFGGGVNGLNILEVFDTTTETLSSIPNPHNYNFVGFIQDTIGWVGQDLKIYLWNAILGTLGDSAGCLFKFDPDTNELVNLGQGTSNGIFFNGAEKDQKNNVFFFTLQQSEGTINTPEVWVLPPAFDGNSSIFVPIVVSSSGMNGSYFTSEMTLTNSGSGNVSLHFTYVDAFNGGSANGTAVDFLAPGQQRVIPDAIKYFRSLGIPIPVAGNQGGTVRVDFSGLTSALEGSFTVRTTTTVSNGRAGLSYAGIPTSNGLSGPVYLCGLRQTTADRSNVAIQNMGSSQEGSITLRLTVFSGDPDHPQSQVLNDIELGPGGFRQISGILSSNGLAITNGYVRVERVAGTAPYYAYGVINDQANSDGSFISPILESSLSGKTRMTLPVIVESGPFTSELTVTNWSQTATTLQCAYVAGSLLTPGHKALFTVSLYPGEQKIIPNFVQYLRNRNVPGIDPAGAAYAGAMFVTASGTGDLSGISVAARTSNPNPDPMVGGEYGLYYTALPDGSTPVADAWLYGLQQNSENRTNLALLNTGEVDGSADTFQIDLYDGKTGTKVGNVPNQTLNALDWGQLNSILATYAPGTNAGYAHIIRVSGNNPFIAYAVINDGAAPGQRSGDGAFIASSQ
jgi:hypothetical protein